MARMEHGQTLAQTGKDAEALAEYWWCFEHGDEVHPSFDCVRLSILLDRIKALGTRYPAAITALETRRNEELSKLRPRATNEHTATELVSLNGILEQKEKNLTVFDRLLPGSPARGVVCDMIMDQLLGAKRYADILACKDAKSAFAEQIELCNEMTDMLNPQNPVKNVTEEGYRSYTVEYGAHLFEALAGVKQNNAGRELAQQILKFDASAGTRKALGDAAERAGNGELAQYVKR